jgi:cytochrome c
MTTRRAPGGRLAIGLAAAMLLIGLSACGGGDDKTAAPPAAEPAVIDIPAAVAAPQPEAVQAAPAAEPLPPEPPAPATSEPPAPPLEGGEGGGASNLLPPQVPPLALEEPVLGEEMAALLEAADPVVGRTYAQRCAGCHAIEPGVQGVGAAQIAPILSAIFGQPIGGVPGYDYSPVFRLMRETGAVWTEARLDAFLTDPAAAVPGTAMFAGAVSNATDRADVIVFLRELAGGSSRGPATGDPELLARIAAADPAGGQALAARCSGCHRFGLGVAPLIGPNLFDIVGNPVGGAEGFGYSPAMRTLNLAGDVWSYAMLDAFLASPAIAVPGTRMGFAGVADANERAAIIAYLRTLSPDPRPIFAVGEPVGNERAGLTPLEFTPAQVDLGAGAYVSAGCVECHRSDLHGEVDMRDDGFGVAPPLIGPNFIQHWFSGTVADGFAFLSTREPKDNPGVLEPQIYADILAYILARNGFTPGGAALTPDSATLATMGFYQ